MSKSVHATWPVAIALTLAALCSLTACSPVQRPVTFKKQEAIDVLRSSEPRDRLCLAGPDRAGMELRVWKLSPTEDLYRRGKYQVPVRLAEGVVGSRFFDDPVDAIESLTAEGVTIFSKCPPPMDM